MRDTFCTLVVARMTSELPARTAFGPEVRLVFAIDEPGESPLAQIEIDEAHLGQTLIDAVWSFLHDPYRTGGMVNTISATHRTASIVRDRISVDGWRIINQLHFPPSHSATAPKTSADLAAALAPLNQLLTWLSAFSGLCNDSMTRGPGWRFLDIGRRIERALQTLRVIRGLLVEAQADVLPLLEAMLEIADSSMTYRYRYLTTLQLAPVLDLVLVDETNPRAVGVSTEWRLLRTQCSREASPACDERQGSGANVRTKACAFRSSVAPSGRR